MLQWIDSRRTPRRQITRQQSDRCEDQHHHGKTGQVDTVNAEKATAQQAPKGDRAKQAEQEAAADQASTIREHEPQHSRPGGTQGQAYADFAAAPGRR